MCFRCTYHQHAPPHSLNMCMRCKLASLPPLPLCMPGQTRHPAIAFSPMDGSPEMTRLRLMPGPEGGGGGGERGGSGDRGGGGECTGRGGLCGRGRRSNMEGGWCKQLGAQVAQWHGRARIMWGAGHVHSIKLYIDCVVVVGSTHSQAPRRGRQAVRLESTAYTTLVGLSTAYRRLPKAGRPRPTALPAACAPHRGRRRLHRRLGRLHRLWRGRRPGRGR